MAEKALVEYNITDAAIAEMEKIYMDLTITDLEDKEQFDAVHSARMTVKGKRVEVEKRRKELKADALEWGRKVDTEAKRIVGKLEPIESHLDREERKVTDEQERIKEEAERKEKEKIDKRIAELAVFGKHLPFFEVAGWTDGEYEARLIVAKDEYEAEQKRLAEEADARKAEAERLEAVRKEQEAKAAELAEAQRKIDEAKAKIEAEKKALEDARREALHKAEVEQAKKEAAERAKKEAEEAAALAVKKAAEKAEREAREAKENSEREAAEKARQEGLKPDKEKLIGYAEALIAVSIPEVASDEARVVREYALRVIGLEADEIIKQAKEL